MSSRSDADAEDVVGRPSMMLRATLGAAAVEAGLAADDEPAGGARVLVADHDTATAALVADALRESGYVVETVIDGETALERVARGAVDVVVLNARMPRLSGIDTCRSIRGLSGDLVPVIVAFAKTDRESRVAALQVGADGWLCKPIERTELLVAVAAGLRLRRAHARMKAAREVLERLRTHDAITGAQSFGALHEHLEAEFARAERLSEPLACCLVDIDGLKAQNERGGRALGDAVLRGVAAIARDAVREKDLVARYGSDELFVMLPGTHFAGSLVVASRIWREVAAATFAASEASGSAAGVTVSIGVALFPSRDVRSREALLRALEDAILEAKRRGGNCVCVFQQEGFIYSPSGDSGR